MSFQEHGEEPTTSRRTEQLSDYLKSPVDTLLESVEDESAERISCCDLIQAYSLFSARVKRLSAAIRDEEERAIAMRYIGDNATTILQCLARDILRVVDDPYPESQEPELGRNVNEVESSQEALSEARNNAALVQHALIITAEVFCIPELSETFNDDDVIAVVGSIRDVLDDPVFPAPGEDKIRTLAIWVLSLLKLTPNVFENKGCDLVKTLRSILAQSDGNEVIIGDALKVLHNLLVQHPTSLPLFVELLPYTLPFLVSHAIVLRKRSAHVLIGYARALLTYKSSLPESEYPVRHTLRTWICQFVELQASLHRRACTEHAADPLAVSQTLPSLIHAEIPQDGKSPVGPHVGWAFAVLHALVVLSDGLIFNKQEFLKFVANTVVPCVIHEWDALRSLHAAVWRALVWAFSRIACLDLEKLRLKRRKGFNFREAVFRTVKQLPDHYVGSSFMYVLMGPGDAASNLEAVTGEPPKHPGKEDVLRGITLLGDLIHSSHRNQRVEGTALLAVCTDSNSKSQDARPWDPRLVLSDTMLDVGLVDADQEHVKQLVDNLPEFLPGNVRRFSHKELVKYWDPIVNIWNEALKEGIQVGTSKALSTSGRLMRTWSGLLRAQNELTRSEEHPQLSARIAKVIVAYAEWTPCCPRLQTTFTGCVVSTRLKTIRQLNNIAAGVLAPEVARLVSQHLFPDVLLLGKEAENKEAKTFWTEVCAELCVCGGADGLIFDPKAADFKIKQKRWNELTELWAVSGLSHMWKGALPFLAIPISSWKMNHIECDNWNDLFKVTIRNAKKSGLKANAIMETICNYIQDTSNKPPHFPIKIVLSLIATLRLKELTDEDAVPVKLLTRLSHYLEYPPSRDDQLFCIKVIRVLGKNLPLCPGKHIVSVLTPLADILCVWIRDQFHWVPDREYDKIATFYCNATSALRATPLNVDDVRSLDSFIASPFLAVQRSVRTLEAFKVYWESIERPWRELTGNAVPPPGIEKGVNIYYHLYPSSRKPYFMLDDSSSSQSDISTTTVPDSQPPIEGEEPTEGDVEDTPRASRFRLAEVPGDPEPLLNHLNERQSSHSVGSEGQASMPTSSQIPPQKAPTSLYPSPSNRHGSPTISSPPDPADLPQLFQADPGSSLLGKRPAEDSELTSPKQRRRTSADMTLNNVAVEEDRAERMRGGRSSPDIVQTTTSRGIDQLNTETQGPNADSSRGGSLQQQSSYDGARDAEQSLSCPSSTDAQSNWSDSDKENQPLKYGEPDKDELLEIGGTQAKQPVKKKTISPLTDKEGFVPGTPYQEGHGRNNSGSFTMEVDGSTVLDTIQRANEQLLDEPDMSAQEIQTALATVNQMRDTLQARIRAVYDRSLP